MDKGMDPATPVYEITFAVSQMQASAMIVTMPEDMESWMDSPFLESEGFKGIPEAPGFYSAKAAFWYLQGYSEGYPADGESSWGFDLESVALLSAPPEEGSK